MKTKKNRPDWTSIAMIAALVAIVAGSIAFSLMRGPATERATAAVEELGYTVVSAERDWKPFTCYGKNDTHVVVHVVENGEDQDISTCVSIWRVKVKD